MERRIALGAPLALTDDGLVLSAPSDDGTEPWLDPGIRETPGSFRSGLFADFEPPPVPAAAVLPLRPSEPAAGRAAKSAELNAAASDLLDAGTMSMPMPPWSRSSGSIISGVGTGEGEGYLPGSFRFEVKTNNGGLPMPSSATINFSLSGSATPGADYTGPLTAGSVDVPLDANGYGFKDVAFTAVDDDLMEPTEDVIPTITGGSVNSGTFDIGSPYSWMATLKSDDGEATPVEIDLTRGGAGANTETGQAKVPEGPALIWKVSKVTTGPAATPATGDITITKSTPGNIGGITNNEYTYEGPPIPAGGSTVYDVEIKTDGGGNYKAKLKVTVKN